jgi:hypothetical protein
MPSLIGLIMPMGVATKTRFCWWNTPSGAQTRHGPHQPIYDAPVTKRTPHRDGHHIAPWARACYLSPSVEAKPNSPIAQPATAVADASTTEPVGHSAVFTVVDDVLFFGRLFGLSNDGPRKPAIEGADLRQLDRSGDWVRAEHSPALPWDAC